MKKFVRYNGKTGTYYHCSDPSALDPNVVYEVLGEYEFGGCQTDYILKGVPGFFNSVWFDSAAENDEPAPKKTYIAVSYEIPVVGLRYKCYTVAFKNGIATFTPCFTPALREATNVIGHFYRIATENATYFVLHTPEASLQPEFSMI